jgi:hypothetical protein
MRKMERNINRRRERVYERVSGEVSLKKNEKKRF